MDYTSVPLVKDYGNTDGTANDDVLTDLVTGYSDQVDTYCRQNFSQATYTDWIGRGTVDRDGVLMVYPPVPTLSTPTAAAHRYGPLATWTDITLSLLDVEPNNHGSIVRVLGSDFGIYRNQRLQVRLTFSGGWADLDAVPADFELAVRRLVWWGYKLREAPMNKTAMPALGQVVIPPSGWPKDIADALKPYRRYYG